MSHYAPQEQPGSSNIKRRSSIALPNDFFELHGVIKKFSLALPRDFLQQSILDFEGLKVIPWALKRDDLCGRLCTLLHKHRLLSICSPFASGKTALAQLLYHFISHTQHKSVYIISFLQNMDVSWEDCWLCQTGVPWDSLLSSGHTIYVIVDNIEVSYPLKSSTHGLWRSIIHVAIKNLPILFVCLGSSPKPETIPVDFPVVVSFHPCGGIPGLAYTQQEFYALCKLYPTRGGHGIDDNSAHYIFHITDGHAGVIGFILNRIYENRRYLNAQGNTADLYTFLHSKIFQDSFHTCRAMPDFSNQIVENICRHVLKGELFRVPKSSFVGSELEQLQFCLRAFLVEDKGTVTFAAPIVRNCALAYYFGNPSVAPSVDDFIDKLVAHVSPQWFDADLRGPQWQQEFHVATVRSLPTDVSMFPDYAILRGKGAKGSQIAGLIGFCIQYKWWIEIVRDGLDIGSYEKYFGPGGQCVKLLDNIDEWFVLDFRTTILPIRRNPRARTYSMSFTSEFSRVKIRDPAGHERVVALGAQINEV